MNNAKEKIKQLLKENPKGLTVTEIAREIDLNRNSVAKYLDVLLVSGQVEMKNVGPAKLYFPSQRVPLSAMLNFSSDHILVLDENLTIVQVNRNILELMEVKRDDILGLKIHECPHRFCPEIKDHILRQGLKGKEQTDELEMEICNEKMYFKAKYVPTIFETGENGVTIILENITQQKRTEQELKIKDKAIEKSINAIAFSDLEGNLTYVNESFLRMWGYQDKKEVLGRSTLSFWETQKKARQVIDALREKDGWIGELVAEKKDGSSFEVHLSASMVKDDNGDPLCMMSSFIQVE